MQNKLAKGRILLISSVVFVYLIVVNAFIFPLVFPDGLAEKFINSRPDPLPLFHVLAFAATAVLLTLLVNKLSSASSSITSGLWGGVWLALLVAVPEHLHLYAMTQASAIEQTIPVVWTVVTWGIAGMIVAAILKKRRG